MNLVKFYVNNAQTEFPICAKSHLLTIYHLIIAKNVQNADSSSSANRYFSKHGTKKPQTLQVLSMEKETWHEVLGQ